MLWTLLSSLVFVVFPVFTRVSDHSTLLLTAVVVGACLSLCLCLYGIACVCFNTSLIAQASEKSDPVSTLTGEVRPKSSYVVALDRDNLLACGGYLVADILQAARPDPSNSEAVG